MTVPGLRAPKASRCHYRAYGVELACDFPIPGALAEPPPVPGLRVVGARALEPAGVASLWSGAEGVPLHEAVVGEGTELVVERGRRGDHLVRSGDHRFHLSPDLAVLTCTPPAATDEGWQRLLCDWAPYLIASLGGTACLHASGVETGAGVIALAGRSGAGKTTLAAELVERGASFFCDDVLALTADAREPWAHPGAPFACIDGRDGERWVAVPGAATEPAPLAAVVVVDRRAVGPARPRLGRAEFVDLRALAIGIGSATGRERQLFEVLGAIAATARLLRLEADSAVGPGSLVEALLAGLEVWRGD
ncbi:MAG TPA: hypothetical protein VMT37_12400 [Solirubrobacterales bacterium]|nr:hypothetical protein [Solirubrobacterales bacterium]